MAKRSPLILGELKRWGWCVSLPNLYLSDTIFQKHFVIDTFFTICCKSIPLSTITMTVLLWLSETGSFALDCRGIEGFLSFNPRPKQNLGILIDLNYPLRGGASQARWGAASTSTLLWTCMRIPGDCDCPRQGGSLWGNNLLTNRIVRECDWTNDGFPEFSHPCCLRYTKLIQNYQGHKLLRRMPNLFS